MLWWWPTAAAAQQDRHRQDVLVIGRSRGGRKIQLVDKDATRHVVRATSEEDKGGKCIELEKLVRLELLVSFWVDQTVKDPSPFTIHCNLSEGLHLADSGRLAMAMLSI